MRRTMCKKCGYPAVDSNGVCGHCEGYPTPDVARCEHWNWGIAGCDPLGYGHCKDCGAKVGVPEMLEREIGRLREIAGTLRHAGWGH